MRTALIASLIFVAACASAPERPIPARSDAEVIATLESRTNAKSLYAVVSIAYDDPRTHGTFKAVVQFLAPGQIRIAAFKDVPGLAEGTIFELLITPDVFRLEVAPHDDAPAESDFGPANDLPVRHPGFAGFAWLREALFLPGRGAAVVTRESAVAYRVEGELPSGKRVAWHLDAETLEVLSGTLRDSPAAMPSVRLRYSDYRAFGGLVVPRAAEYEDKAARIAMSMRLLDLEPNPDLDPGLFKPWPPRSPK